MKIVVEQADLIDILMLLKDASANDENSEEAIKKLTDLVKNAAVSSEKVMSL